MRQVPRPGHQLDDVLSAARTIRLSDEAERSLSAVSVRLRDDERNYEIDATRDISALGTWTPWPASLKNQSKVLKWLYVNRLRRGPARHIYDALRASAPRGICPYCDIAPVRTLDHYMPQDVFPELSVTPINLVPLCGGCNTAKSTKPSSEFFNPYFDTVPEHRWLVGTLIKAPSPAVSFSVTYANDPSDGVLSRVEATLRALGILDSWAAHAAQLVNQRSHLLRRRYAEATESDRRAVLSEQARADELAFGDNSWQAVTTRAIEASQWFVEEGFMV